METLLSIFRCNGLSRIMRPQRVYPSRAPHCTRIISSTANSTT
ncbi:unnamed protein product [Oppiella nova]|uniref:Uncharacterized protein n=1 Tax=Oppiella nova TaxID=334625 RepID=A0A7R9MRZ9_9ACAR|nr:unnamed protein product [Oppiella nova]CAG2182514.1 unnamed protein product [Oppiella nova]